MQLLFFLTGEFNDEDVAALQTVVLDLRVSLEWLEAPPEFVNQTDDTSEEELRTVGGILQLPPVGAHATERRGLEDLMQLIDMLQRYSRTRSKEIEFELDGTFVGDIQNGELSRTLRVGLIDPWRERVRSS